MLDLAALYLFGCAEAQLMKGEKAQQFLDLSLWFGYKLKVNLAGWRQFCEGQNRDPDPFMEHLPGKEVLGIAAELAEKHAFTAEAAFAFVIRQNMKADTALTAEDVAADLREALNIWAAWWG
jgi:hypothetical protein